MKTSNTWSFRSIVSKIMMGLVLATMIGSMDVVPANAKGGGGGGHERMGHDSGRYQHRGRGYDRGHYAHKGQGYDRHRYGYGRPDYRSYGYYGPYGYRERVYAPPPGIGVFFPPIFIHP